MPGGDGTGPTGAGSGTGGGGGSCIYKNFNLLKFTGKKNYIQNNNLLITTNKPIFNIGIQKDEFIRTKK